MAHRPLIFLSSTSDLSVERRALSQGLPGFYELFLYENERAGSRSPQEY